MPNVIRLFRIHHSVISDEAFTEEFFGDELNPEDYENERAVVDSERFQPPRP